MTIEFDKKQYYIDVDRLSELSFIAEKAGRREQEITDGYEIDGDSHQLRPITKMIREINARGDSTNDGLRYDFLKTVILLAFSIESPDEINFGDRLVLNTLIKYKILVEITD